MKKIIIAAFVLLASTALFAQPTAEEILTNSRKAMNYDGLSETQTFVITGTQFIAALGQEIDIKMHIKRPDLIRVELELMGMQIIQAYNGKKGWSINPLTGSSDVKTMQQEEIDQMKSTIELIDSPTAKFGEEGYSFVYSGTETIDEKVFNVVDATNKEGNKSKLYFDAVTNWFYKLSAEVPGPEGEDVTLEIIYDEKTRVNKIILPKMIEVKVDNQTSTVYKFEEYKLGEDLNPEIFDK